jgi:uncharacterized protein (TIGR03083 family)
LITAPRPTTPSRAHEVATEELAAFLDLLGDLGDADWQLPTECDGWTVRDIVAHVTGAMEEGARLRVQLRHLVTAQRRYPHLASLDAVNQMQIDERRDVTHAELLAELADLGPRAARARRKMPRLLRARRVPGDNPLPVGATFGYLVDVIYPRDLWMHRVDVERATGRPHAPTSAEDTVVAEVVRDLADGWDGPPTTLTLTGRGSGTWQLGAGTPVAALTAEAVETCRLLSGRMADPAVDGTGAGAHDAGQLLEATRIPF